MTLYISCAAELRLKTASFMMSPVSSVTAICARSGYGKSQLCRIFREETLQTISGQITVCCLNNARTLLSTGK